MKYIKNTLKVHARWPRFEGGCYLGEDGVPELGAFGGSVDTVDGGLPDLDGSVFGEVKVGSCACRGEDASLVPVDDVSGCPAVMREG